MSPAEKFAQLEAESSRNLVNFLGIELDLCHSMLDLANGTHNEDHRASLLATVMTAIRTVRHFEGRVKDQGVRASIEERVISIEALVREVPS